MATTGSNARGFVPTRRQDGSPPSPANRYATGSNPTIIMLGDPVFLNANRKVQKYLAQHASANSPAVLGVVVGLLNSDGRPLTHAAEKKIGVSADGFIQVVDDPDCLFEIECSASISPTTGVGNFATVVETANTTANGRSGVKLAETNVVTAAGHPFQLYSLAPTELDRAGGPNNNWLVRISNHVFRRSTRLQGPIEAADA